MYDPAENTFQKIRCKTDLPMSFFFKWKGFNNKEEVEDALVSQLMILFYFEFQSCYMKCEILKKNITRSLIKVEEV